MDEIPTEYRCAVKALSELRKRKQSLRSIMRQFHGGRKFKTIYVLIDKVVKNVAVIKKVIEHTQLKQEINDCNDLLLEVLVAELLFGQKFEALKSINSDIIKQILEHESKIKQNYERIKKTKAKSSKKDATVVKYVRVNLLKTTMDRVVKLLTESGFSFVSAQIDTLEQFIETASKLQLEDFLKDFNFPNELIVINAKATIVITALDEYKAGEIIFQDKASLFPIEMMRLKPNMKVLDVCGAPGTKTAVMASRCLNNIKITTIDKDQKRCDEMKKLMKSLNVTCVDIKCQDFLDSSFKVEENVDVILLDPSCSGSGMFDRHEYGEKKFDKGRCLKLASFQTKMLCKAMSLKPKRIVYSTCSVNTIENELVIKSAFKESPDSSNYKLIKDIPSWPKRGAQELVQCIRSDSEFLTKGFFAAVMKRVEKTN
ncbi:williams-beuren syndrome critical region-like protein [Dinothrombium tinctorium]|uniref:Williams-beuren syndrome critical region-like protein n=1 Tax=Dinothrombium tinctorium TaxID=1965070 RepID=A0A3S3R0X7_9ACAR|nr:williams-beuren syndrome critical region-like protein [Dinothrombium tinctorium]RWS16847.1 williams-beuren syndrome critical region-like protein [Dinothrombium tinctorium]RWS16871.1 williams-beuren syndrome critical region-like protein [Dinothrombium tinctorium]